MINEFEYVDTELKFTPLEFETGEKYVGLVEKSFVKIYSVGVWNVQILNYQWLLLMLKFTPLEFETLCRHRCAFAFTLLKFTPLEFETLSVLGRSVEQSGVKIYSVGVWNNWYVSVAIDQPKLKFTPLEFETLW